MSYVPVLDLTRLDSDPSGFSNALGEAFEETGFATVVNHGVRSDLIHNCYKAARNVFKYDDKFLAKYENHGNGHQTGFTPFGTEHAKGVKTPDQKRFWHVRRLKGGSVFGPNIWPTEVPDFELAMTLLYEQLETLALRLLEPVNWFLGMESGTLSDMIRGGETLLRAVHYPPLTNDQRGLRAAPHEDINLITLLVAATASGLQVQTMDKKWVAVNEEADSIVVNVGDMLQMLTQGRLRSTRHQVVNPKGSADQPRFSLPMFVHPRSEVVLRKSDSFTAGQYLQQRLQEIGLYAGAGAAARK
ncbi:isopenicillin N synthase family oxygenase [Candidatus Uhrbacteria bacterium]|nr:isopenicillin N synthase family oxygenase [Candidatus Uhrbacteria bacterium]